ncbi:lysophospholipid acyltransferase family protein [Rikenella microfusus]|uniref:lysophospholipid acyltransferase family protein n=1 Tax=Rikenella microfusus TaxID=28139 RepID=UPI001DEA473D|nr:GNAT family N-acyltransferase [Rikenella microfusus]HJE89358.1 lysophospholipid acyltransferase family protein [Rikenella microfusus]
MKKLVDNSDLGIPYTTVLNKAVVKLAQSMLGINKINRLYSEASGKEGIDFARAVLDQLGIVAETDAGRLGFIPEKGPFVLVSNHPHGALDGLLLMVLVARIRPDVKFLGNFLLTKIDTLNEFFLPVDPFDAKNGRNISGVRRAVEHLKAGRPLVVFPAGEVSTYRKGFSKIEDKPWSRSVSKLILRAGVPVIPAYIEGCNSLIFHLLGKIHPMLRTVRLPLELTNKKGRSVAVAFGSAVPAKLLKEIGSAESVSDFLRANVYCLRSVLTDTAAATEELEAVRRATVSRLGFRKKRKAGGGKSVADELAEPVDPLLLGRELDALAGERMLTRVGNMCLFCAPTSVIPLTMKEIARLREVTFRAVGEGTQLETDSDEYDDLYEHLFVWDAEKQAIAGAYRIGFGDVLLDNRGFEGFYTYTLFEFSRRLNDVLRQSIELGRSFVVPGYQRRSQTLLLLWRGILHVLLRNPSYRYLMGPVSMSGGYAMAAKWLLIDYIKANHWNAELARYVVPRNGVGALGRPAVDEEMIRRIVSTDEIDKLIRDVEPSGQGMPVLMKKYLQLGGRVMGFNIDPLFNDALDAMLILDLCDVPKDKIDMVAREFAGENVYERFRSVGNTKL